MDGQTIAEAVGMEFLDSAGKLQKYRRDIFYDLFKSKWIRLETEPTGAAAAAHTRKDTSSSEEASSLDSSSFVRSESTLPDGPALPDTATSPEPKPRCFFRSVYEADDPPHAAS